MTKGIESVFPDGLIEESLDYRGYEVSQGVGVRVGVGEKRVGEERRVGNAKNFLFEISFRNFWSDTKRPGQFS